MNSNIKLKGLYMNQNLPLVTIMMPCRDPKPPFFKKALDSVFSQSNQHWKLIVIHDNCNDISIINMLRELGNSEDIRITVLKNESKLITGAMNTGMRHSKTPFVCSLLCDDLLDKNTIEVSNRYILLYPNIDFFHSSRMYIDQNGKPISKVFKARETFDISDFKYRGQVRHLLCWKVESALAIGGMDESLGLHGADDYDFPWCMAEAGNKFKAIPECLYYYRDHREHYRLTTHVPLNTQIKELKKILKKHGISDKEIEEQINWRTSNYLNQALYIDEEDKKRKENINYDIRKGWKQKYS